MLNEEATKRAYAPDVFRHGLQRSRVVDDDYLPGMLACERDSVGVAVERLATRCLLRL